MSAQSNLRDLADRLGAALRARPADVGTPLNSFPGGACHRCSASCLTPDLGLLWQSAAVARVSTRALLLTRPASELLYDARWPHDGYAPGRAVMLTRVCRRMRRQLGSVPRAHIFCVPYHDTCNNTGRQERLERFLDAPGAGAVLCERFRKTQRRRPPIPAALHPTFQRLQKCTSLVEGQFCAGAS